MTEFSCKRHINELHQDTRLWDYHRQLVPNVDKALRRAPEVKGWVDPWH